MVSYMWLSASQISNAFSLLTSASKVYENVDSQCSKSPFTKLARVQRRQFPLDHLANVVSGEFVDEYDTYGNAVGRQAFPAPRQEIVLGKRITDAHHERPGHLAQPFVGNTDDRSIAHTVGGHQHVLDGAGKHLEPAAVDHVRHPTVQP